MTALQTAAMEPHKSEARTSDKRVVAVLRQMIMDGELTSGSLISEVRVSEMFDVSRTPARLALRALEVEGLILKRSGRGYTVREFNPGDLSKAYEVRGVLEGLAASTLARAGMTAQTAEGLCRCVSDTDRMLDDNLSLADTVAEYQRLNTQFHETIMTECGNDFIARSFSRLEALPLVRLGTVVFNEAKSKEELMRLRFGNMQHRVILDAIERGDSFRAETLMREHANQVPLYTGLLV